MRPTLKRVVATFGEDGSLEVAITYRHAGEPPTPGSSRRVATASRMASAALEAALERLGKGSPLWGGFGTNTSESTDRVIVERKEQSS